MKHLIIVILFLLQSSLLFAQQEKSYIKKGNALYQQQKYGEAEADYRKSVEKNPYIFFANLGRVLFQWRSCGYAVKRWLR